MHRTKERFGECFDLDGANGMLSVYHFLFNPRYFRDSNNIFLLDPRKHTRPPAYFFDLSTCRYLNYMYMYSEVGPLNSKTALGRSGHETIPLGSNPCQLLFTEPMARASNMILETSTGAKRERLKAWTAGRHLPNGSSTCQYRAPKIRF